MIRSITTVAEMQAAREALSGSIGLVPTMGFLHGGHLSLVRRSKRDNDHTIVSIFVNPTQFGAGEDFERYPRNEDRDLAICAEEGVDLVWAPPEDEVYPPGFDTRVSVGAIARPLEGAARPGHFDGVATVVAILFALVGAERAYFGQKDAQQVMVIDRMARDLALPTEVIGCPTVREPDGLALSSRNVHLTPEQRAAAPVIHRALLAGCDRYRAGERAAEAIRSTVRQALADEPLAAPEYVSCADAATLAELERVDRPTLLSVAVRFGTTRLIDNEPLG